MGVDRKRKTYQVGWSPKIRLPIGVKFRSRRLNHPADVFFFSYFPDELIFNRGPHGGFVPPWERNLKNMALLREQLWLITPYFSGLFVMGVPAPWGPRLTGHEKRFGGRRIHLARKYSSQKFRQLVGSQSYRTWGWVSVWTPKQTPPFF